MITKMTKYSFILFHKEVLPFLDRLQDIGMVDIIRENKAIDDHSKELLGKIQNYSAALKRINELKESLAEIKPAGKLFDKEQSTSDLFNTLSDALEKRENLIAEKRGLERDYEEALLWGAYKKEDINKLESLGYTLHFFSISESNYKPEWERDYILQIINKNQGKYYFVILSPSEEEFHFKIPESKFPPVSCDILKEKIDYTESYITWNRELLAEYALQTDLLEERLNKEKAIFDLYLAGSSSKIEAEGTLALMTGFAPQSQSKELLEFFDNEGIFYIAESAREEDNPPIKLKNNFFSRLFEPIGELYMLPKYGELDLTPYFAPFYMLFFGLCLGDMGYGIVLLLLGVIGKFKFPKYKDYLSLIQLLGIGSIIMPLLTGSIFGTKLAVIFPLPDSVNALFFSDIKMFWFAIIFGVFQIVIGKLINAIFSIITKGWQYGMHNIGWAIVIIWASFAYAKTMVPELSLPDYVNYIGLFGCSLILFFSATEGNIIIRIFKGTFAFYDITGVFGDVLSYIRLFGLGTSGGILGFVVNSIAMNMIDIPYVGWFFTGLVLLIGHTFVLLLSSLGAFVHPMRLTFVEFYKNSGFTGGGKAFRPLTKN